MKNILNYRAREEKFFLDYLPDELFINLTEPQRINFRKLRENHLLIQKAESEIQDLYSEIKEKIIAAVLVKKAITIFSRLLNLYQKM